MSSTFVRATHLLHALFPREKQWFPPEVVKMAFKGRPSSASLSADTCYNLAAPALSLSKTCGYSVAGRHRRFEFFVRLGLVGAPETSARTCAISR